MAPARAPSKCLFSIFNPFGCDTINSVFGGIFPAIRRVVAEIYTILACPYHNGFRLVAIGGAVGVTMLAFGRSSVNAASQ
jgi:hypothetical protein